MHRVKFILRLDFFNQKKKKNFIFNIHHLCQKFNIFYSENNVKKSYRQSI